MKIIRILFLTTFIILFFSGCRIKHPNEVEFALSKLDYTTAKKFEKVFSNYKRDKDSLKLKAAYYLFNNMHDKVGIYYSDDAFFLDILRSLDSVVVYNSCPDFIETHLEKRCRPYNSLNETDLKNVSIGDLDTITSKFLIENIDFSFKVWEEKPWAKHLNFDEFCEWILPYRIGNEPLQSYRKFFYNEFAWLEDSMQNTGSAQEACYRVNKYISEKYIYSDKLNFLPLLGALDAYNTKAGTCLQRYSLLVLVMRSLGIPVTIDFTPQFPRKSDGHAWTVLFDSDRKIKPFNGGERKIVFSYPPICPIGENEKVTTIFRNVFFTNTNTLLNNLNYFDLPENFRNKNIVEVTDEYTGLITRDVQLRVPKKYEDQVVFLFSFNRGIEYTAVSCCKISNEKAIFRNIGSDGIYFVGMQNGGSVDILSHPFILLDSGKKQYIVPDEQSLEKVILTRKFPVKWTMQPFIEMMKGASLQGSNSKDFSQLETLFIINEDVIDFREFTLKPKQAYRYYRYVSAHLKDIRIADIQLLSNKNGQIKGEIYGHISNPDSCVETNFKNAFDNNIRTNLNAPAGSWVGIDAGIPTKLSSFRIMCRNHFNIIEPGDTYELFYFNKVWNSLGKKNSSGYSIEFDNVPKGAILLLRNLSKGRDERIFLYENGKQVWW